MTLLKLKWKLHNLLRVRYCRIERFCLVAGLRWVKDLKSQNPTFQFFLQIQWNAFHCSVQLCTLLTSVSLYQCQYLRVSDCYWIWGMQDWCNLMLVISTCVTILIRTISDQHWWPVTLNIVIIITCVTPLSASPMSPMTHDEPDPWSVISVIHNTSYCVTLCHTSIDYHHSHINTVTL